MTQDTNEISMMADNMDILELDTDEQPKNTCLFSDTNALFVLDDSHVGTMYTALLVSGDKKKSEKWSKITIQEFKTILKSGSSINKRLTRVELLDCIRPLMVTLRENKIVCKLSWPKHKLVNLLSTLCGDGTEVQQNVRRKSSVSSMVINNNLVYIGCFVNCIITENVHVIIVIFGNISVLCYGRNAPLSQYN